MKFTALALLAALALVACDSSDTPGPTPTSTPTVYSEGETPQPTATPDLAACPVDAATCAAAQPFIDAWRAEDIDALVAMSAPLEAKCTVPRPSGLGGPYPLCDDATIDGELRHGYVWSSGSHGGLTTEANYRERLGARIGAEPMLTIGCELVPGTTDCKGDFSLVFGPVANNAVSELAILRDASGAAAVGVLPVLVSGCETSTSGQLCELVSGGVTGARAYRYWGDESQIPRPLPTWTFLKWSP